MKGDQIDLYEVKCSYRIIKAKKQLEKAKKLLGLEKCDYYFYCGDSGVIVMF